jgi:NagD protein
MLETATGRRALSVGKPSPVMMRMARSELGVDASRTTMIGDTMETDILGGVQLGYYTILVLSGSTRREDLDRYGYRPELVVDSVADLCSGSQLADIRTSSSTEDDTPLDLRQWALTHGA